MENNTFPLRLSELPETLQNKIQRDIACYGTVLFLNRSIFVGSGTFVGCGNTYGILTAHHILFNPISRNYFDFSSESTQRLGLGITSLDFHVNN